MLKVTCVCGWEVVGDEEEVVAATQEHGRQLHNMDSTRDQVLALAQPVPAPPSPQQDVG